MNGYMWREIVGKRQDRLIAFFDAVLAIAITVLALEMVIPAVGNISVLELKEFAVSVTCYLISFIAMAMLWYIHTKFFSKKPMVTVKCAIGIFCKQKLLT